MINKYPRIDKRKTAYRIIDDEVIVVDLENSTFHSLNSLASFIWQHLDGKSTIKEIIENICQDFEVDKTTAQEDCLNFIQELIDKKLILLENQKIET